MWMLKRRDNTSVYYMQYEGVFISAIFQHNFTWRSRSMTSVLIGRLTKNQLHEISAPPLTTMYSLSCIYSRIAYHRIITVDWYLFLVLLTNWLAAKESMATYRYQCDLCTVVAKEFGARVFIFYNVQFVVNCWYLLFIATRDYLEVALFSFYSPGL